MVRRKKREKREEGGGAWVWGLLSPLCPSLSLSPAPSHSLPLNRVPVRVEVELRKLQDARPELGQLVPPGLPGARSSGGGGGGAGGGLNTPRGLQAGEGRPLLPA